jgi:hypothetical protein
MMDPAVERTRPDVGQLVWQTVKDIPGIRTWEIGALPLPAPIGWLVATSIQVDVRASAKKVTYDRAMEARRRLLALAYEPWDAGVLTAVNILEDFWWFPDDDGAPRYIARFEVVAHPQQRLSERTAL